MSKSQPLKPTTPNTERVSMRTLAERLGVTKTTISLALRGHTSISQATRDRVSKLARELNYRPDPAIAAIAAQRWGCGSLERHRVVAFLCHRSPSLKVNQIEYHPGVKERAEELGYKIEVFFIDDYPNAESLTRVLYTRGTRGIIVAPIQNPDSKRAMNLEWDKFTAVCCGVGRVRPNLHTVSSDTFETTRRVWELVAKAGHKRIGAALHCHNPIADDDWQRIGASTAAIRFLNLSESVNIPIHTEDINDDALLMKWYERHRPEVVIGFNQSISRAFSHNKQLPPFRELKSLGIVKVASDAFGDSSTLNQAVAFLRMRRLAANSDPSSGSQSRGKTST